MNKYFYSSSPKAHGTTRMRSVTTFVCCHQILKNYYFQTKSVRYYSFKEALIFSFNVRSKKICKNILTSSNNILYGLKSCRTFLLGPFRAHNKISTDFDVMAHFWWLHFDPLHVWIQSIGFGWRIGILLVLGIGVQIRFGTGVRITGFGLGPKS